MKRYIGTKIIDAEPMTEQEFLASQGAGNNQENRPGYKVIYPDGYVSWSPKDVFEKAYHELLIGNEEGIGNVLPANVFPSKDCTVAVAIDPDYNGAHRYQFQNSLGFSDGEAKYDDSYQEIQFVQKNLDGSMTPGLQSEQLILAIYDRTKKLNNNFPSEQNIEMMDGLQIFLNACKQRIQDRIDRGVMGDLKK